MLTQLAGNGLESSPGKVKKTVHILAASLLLTKQAQSSKFVIG